MATETRNTPIPEAAREEYLKILALIERTDPAHVAVCVQLLNDFLRTLAAQEAT